MACQSPIQGRTSVISRVCVVEKCKIRGNLTTLPTLSVSFLFRSDAGTMLMYWQNDEWWVTNKTAAGSPILVVDGKQIAHIEPICTFCPFWNYFSRKLLILNGA